MDKPINTPESPYYFPGSRVSTASRMIESYLLNIYVTGGTGWVRFKEGIYLCTLGDGGVKTVLHSQEDHCVIQNHKLLFGCTNFPR
jgi:hypothetical protein